MVLRESLELAKKEPRIFLPKTIYILISSIWMLGLFSSYGQSLIYIAAFPFLMYLSFFTSVMIANMAKSPEKESLIFHFLYVFNLKKSLTYLVIAIFGISFLVSLPIALGAFLVLQTTYTLLGYFLIISGVIISITTSFFLFFIPISFIENSNINSVIKNSYSMSKGNSKEVLLLFIISIALLGGSQVSEGVFRDLSIAGFLIGRLLESFASTYVFILGSKFYLEKK